MSLLLQKASGAKHVGMPRKTLGNEDKVFDHTDPVIKEDIIRMIVQYLHEEGYTTSVMTIQDEANVKGNEQGRMRNQFRRLKKAILEGEWGEVEKLLARTSLILKDHKSLLYTIYKQQYLEYVDQMEYQKAFALLSKRLKPLEISANMANEFKDLCYLLTCKSVQDAPSFKNWEGITASREKLVEQFSAMVDYESTSLAAPRPEMDSNRLLHLLKQAVRYQIEFSRYHPKVCPHVTTLLEDYSCFVLPNAHKTTLKGHRDNVKCVDFVGEGGMLLVSGSSDNTVRLWDTQDGGCLRVFGGDGEFGTGGAGHTSRIWDISASSSGEHVASASGDATIKLWDLNCRTKSACVTTMTGHEGDVYTVKFHPSNTHVATGGYDKTVRLWDARTGQLVKVFAGHNASVSRVIFNPHGNLIITGSKDSTIRFWDIVSGVCVNSFSSRLGEVTSVEMNRSGSLLLSGSKDNSNRLWDVRLQRPIQRYKGHQNTSKNFVRVSFGPNESLIVGGSEDGLIYIWDATTGEVLQRLGSDSPHRHQGIAYRAIWNADQSLLASCSHDSTVKLWWYDETVPLTGGDDDEELEY